MPGYSYFDILHDNAVISANQVYDFTLVDFRTLTYNFRLNSSPAGTTGLLIFVDAINGAVASRIYTSRQMRFTGSVEGVTILLPGQSIRVTVSIGTLVDPVITDSVIGSG